MMIALHRVALITVSAIAIASAPGPARGQADRAIVMTILVECAKIGDPAARTACFDNNIGIAGPALPASSQDPTSAERNVITNILIECAKIDQPASRTSCYDNNMRGGGSVVATTVQNRDQNSPVAGVSPGTRDRRTPAAVAGRADPRAPAAGNTRLVEGFGPNTDVTRITPTVSSVTERRPGAYLLTFQDGAQWEFVEDMPPTYEAPARGSIVEIERGTFGSFLLRFDRQRPVRVQRVR